MTTPSSDEVLKVKGVGRDADYLPSLIVYLNREATDNELRDIHEQLAGRESAAGAGQQDAHFDESIRALYVPAPMNLHPATADLVAKFAWRLAIKLRKAEQKYGYSNGWQNADWMDECRAQLIAHVHKGDPLDVAAYCAFLFYHDESTAPPPASAAAKVPEPASVLCLTCGIDRAQEDCKGDRLKCAIGGVGQAAPEGSAASDLVTYGTALVKRLIERLRDTPNWLRESFDEWKSCTTTYDRAPFEAADLIEQQAARIASLESRVPVILQPYIEYCPGESPEDDGWDVKVKLPAPFEEFGTDIVRLKMCDTEAEALAFIAECGKQEVVGWLVPTTFVIKNRLYRHSELRENEATIQQVLIDTESESTFEGMLMRSPYELLRSKPNKLWDGPWSHPLLDQEYLPLTIATNPAPPAGKTGGGTT